uniref:Uncharacterized protein n=1 Tax=Arcella intermedia TaxID=1963864 RepID=A0A6B2L487_9EUKA
MTTKDVKSAIIIKLPDQLSSQIQEIRKVYDKAYERWMPHINLIYPFMPTNLLSTEVAEKLENAISTIPPFQISLSEFNHFAHGITATVHLVPEPLPVVKHLQAAIQAAFPAFDDLSAKSDSGFQPHLTIGQTTKLKTFLSEIQPTYRAVSWFVDEIHIIKRTALSPFHVVHTVKIGKNAPLLPPQPSAGPNKKPAPQKPAPQKSAPQKPGPRPPPEEKSAPPKAPKQPVPQRAPPAQRAPPGESKKDEKPKEEDPPFKIRIPLPTDVSKPKFSFDPSAYLPNISKRIQKWAKKRRTTSELPRTRDAFRNSIKAFCTLRAQILDPEYVYHRLYLMNYIEFDEDEDLILVARGLPVFPDAGRDSSHWIHELSEQQQDVLLKCFKWVVSLELAPKNLSGLKTSLSQLVVGKCEVNPNAVLDYMIEQNLIAMDQTTSKLSYLF